MSERTLILFKPDALQRQICGKILQRYEEKGLQIVAMKLLSITREQAEKHYEEHKDKPFFVHLVEYLISSPFIAMVLCGNNAIKIARMVNGATDPAEALPGTIRGDLAMNKRFNLVHASDSLASADREIQIFFKPNEIYHYSLPVQQWF